MASRTPVRFVSTNAAGDDDGLFDAVYFFTVPATTTGGTLTVNTGQEVGDEYTGFTGTGNSTIINLTASATVSAQLPGRPEPSAGPEEAAMGRGPASGHRARRRILGEHRRWHAPLAAGSRSGWPS